MSLYHLDNDMEALDWSQLGPSEMIKPTVFSTDDFKAEELPHPFASHDDEDRAVPQTPTQQSGMRTRGVAQRASASRVITTIAAAGGMTSPMCGGSNSNSPKQQRRYKYYPDEMPAIFSKHNETDVSKEEKNRQSARDCRLRKKLYMLSLEKKLREAESVIAEQQAALKAQRDAIAALTRENQMLVALSAPAVPVPAEEPNSPTFQAVLNLVSSA